MTALTATAGLTLATRHAWLNLLLRNTTHTPASNVYAGLLTAAPDDSGTYSELAGTTRQAVAFTSAAARATETTADATFTAVPGGTDVTWVGLFDASTSGTLIAAGPADTPVDPGGDDLVIPAAGLKVVVADVLMTDYAANALLNHELRSESYSPAVTVESALFDETGTEFSGGTYARVTVTFGAAASSECANSAQYQHVGLPAETWAESRICEDAAGGGNGLYVLTPSSPKPVAAGSSLTFPVGSTKCGLL